MTARKRTVETEAGTAVALPEERTGEVVPLDSSSPLAVAAHTLQVAIAKGIDPDGLEKLVALQERMVAFQARTQFFEDYGNMQACLEPVEKTKKVDSVTKRGKRIKWAYAPLDKVEMHVRPLLARFGFSYSFDQELTAEMVRATFVLKHKGGHEERTTFTAPIDKEASMNTTQQFASATTLARRHAMLLGIGLSTKEKDDDGASLTKDMRPIGEHQAADIRLAVEELGRDHDRFLSWLGVSSYDQIHRGDLERIEREFSRARRRQEMRNGVEGSGEEGNGESE